MNRRTALTLLAAVPLLASPLTAQTGGDHVAQFRKTYSNLKSVDVQFESDGAKGRLQASKGGRFNIDLGDRLFVCDGEKLHTVQRSSKTVLIDAYSADETEMSVERVFFVLFNVYEVKDGGSNANGKKVMLTPPDASAQIGGVEEVIVQLDKKGRITSISVIEFGSRTTWDIVSIKLDPKLADSVFKYQAPKGWQQIDLR